MDRRRDRDRDEHTDGNGTGNDGRRREGESATGSGEQAGGGEAGDASVSWAERVVMLVALGFTVALFSFAVWQSFVGVTAVPPSANVTAVGGGTENVTYYVVTLRNRGDVGLVSATVGVDCPTPSRSVTFENVPAQSRRNATVSCPADSGAPSAAVTTWVSE